MLSVLAYMTGLLRTEKVVFSYYPDGSKSAVKCCRSGRIYLLQPKDPGPINQ